MSNFNHKEYMRKWRKGHPDKVAIARQRASDWYYANKAHANAAHRLRVYGLSPQQYAQLLLQQSGVCAICGKPPGKKSLHIDHDHETGIVRGLLCGTCNTGLGMFKDDVMLLRKAATYIDTSRI